MTERDRLIELINQANQNCSNKDCAECEYLNNDRIMCDTYNIADHLLANGAILPPCKCKDCTYLRESDTTNRMFCTYHGDSYEFEVFPNHYCSNGVGMAKGA